VLAAFPSRGLRQCIDPTSPMADQMLKRVKSAIDLSERIARWTPRLRREDMANVGLSDGVAAISRPPVNARLKLSTQS
jgi:hypothetical protein